MSAHGLHRIGCALAFLAAAPAVGAGEERRVDLALVLAVDVSSSMSAAEQRAQRDGYVKAFRSHAVFDAIATGPRGAIAVTYVEWAGPKFQVMRVPWTVIASAGEAHAFAGRLAASPLTVERSTSISAALAFAAAAFTMAPEADHDVVDISGDGPNNAGADLGPMRDALLAESVTINGLAIALPRSGGPDTADGFGPGFVEAYYKDCVIGGPGAFVIPVDQIEVFEDAIREKLILEIAGIPPRIMRAGYRPPQEAAVSCGTTGMAPGR